MTGAWFCVALGLAAPPAALTWPEARDGRQQQVARHMRVAATGYKWFAHAAHGRDAGTPVILLKLLPELAPDIWGPPEERLARFGFFDSPETAGAPLPLGLGWAQNPVAGDAELPLVRRATLTCAACHVGRVRVPGEPAPRVLVGASNTEIDVRKFRHALHLSAARLLAAEALPGTAARVKELVAAKPAGYFFGDLYGGTGEAEAAERGFFAGNAAAILGQFGQGLLADKAVLDKQVATAYSRPDAPPLTGGTPGQSDGSGDLLPKLVFAREFRAHGAGALKLLAEGDFPELPRGLATATDNLSVWNQRLRSLGQLDGSVKVPLVRNIAAQVAVVGSSEKVNVANADIAASFTAGLPAPPYPFAVDEIRAARGRLVYTRHCQACHADGRGDAPSPLRLSPTEEIGTDPNRARVLTPAGRALFQDAFLGAIPKGYTATSPDGTRFDASALKPDDVLNDRTRPDSQGYTAGPLDGVWARAPYLHNGSVPTLRHLLAPDNPESRRPAAFLRGSIDYDPVNVGFAWNPASPPATPGPTAALFDTRWDGAGRAGHDRDVLVEGLPRRLNFSGPQRRAELEDLIEYLKTL